MLSDFLMSRLYQLIQSRAILKGDFELKSGQKSNYYVDMRRITMTSRGAILLGTCLWNFIEEHLYGVIDKSLFDSIGGVATAGIPVVQSLLAMAGMDHVDLRGFYIRAKDKDHGTQSRIEGDFRSGDSCIVMDDVTTTGDSLARACEFVETQGGKVLLAVSVLHRGQPMPDLADKFYFRPMFTIDQFDLGDKG